MIMVGRNNNDSSSRNRRAKEILAGKGLQRDDSDDELGREDHNWEWIYNDDACRPGIPEIKGARHGSGFQCMLGDCVLLKADGERQAWVGLICEFEKDIGEGEKGANFMWFSTEKEIRNRDKKRTDFVQNELYITPAWDLNPLDAINGSAKVYSFQDYNVKYPSGRVTKSESGKVFLCRRACNTRTATYSEEFDWETIYGGSETVSQLVEFVKLQTKATRKRKIKHVDDEWSRANSASGTPATPRKKRQISQPASKNRVPKDSESELKTPTSKRILVKKPLEFTPLGTRILSPNTINRSPFQVARTRLHVASVPVTLPCREEAFATVYSYLEAAISDGSGSCIYISGTPGTGKTATVREVVAQLSSAVQAEELDDFIFVEINGMKVTDPHQSYCLLWEALRGERVTPLHAVGLLEREFSNPSPRRIPCVVLMDELDQLVTKNQSVMYNFFNWPGFLHSRLIVLAVANTMDLPERTLSNKISSRLGLTRITFPGYTHEQLMQIIQSRLEGVPGDLVDSDAVQFASRKVAAVSGDARRALDICRRAVEIAELESHEIKQLETPSRRSGSKSGSRVISRPLGRVTIATIKEAISEATSGPLQEYLRTLPLASKIFLGAFSARNRRSGLSESALGNIIDEAKLLIQLSNDSMIQQLSSHDARILISDAVTSDGPGWRDSAPRLPALGVAAKELAEAGIIGLDMGKGERSARTRLIVSEDDLKLAFRNDNEARAFGLS